MNLYQLSELVPNNCVIKVVSAYNGKTLAHNYDPTKHEKLNHREISAIYSDIAIIKGNFGNWTKSVIVAMVHGAEEYEKEHKKELNK